MAEETDSKGSVETAVGTTKTPTQLELQLVGTSPAEGQSGCDAGHGGETASRQMNDT